MLSTFVRVTLLEMFVILLVIFWVTIGLYLEGICAVYSNCAALWSKSLSWNMLLLIWIWVIVLYHQSL